MSATRKSYEDLSDNVCIQHRADGGNRSNLAYTGSSRNEDMKLKSKKSNFHILYNLTVRHKHGIAGMLESLEALDTLDSMFDKEETEEETESVCSIQEDDRKPKQTLSKDTEEDEKAYHALKCTIEEIIDANGEADKTAASKYFVSTVMNSSDETELMKHLKELKSEFGCSEVILEELKMLVMTYFVNEDQ